MICNNCKREVWHAHNVSHKKTLCHSCYCKDQPDSFKCTKCGEYDTKSSWCSFALFFDGLCHSCSFWQDYVNKKDAPASVRIDGKHYWVEPENSRSNFRGFGGRTFVIKFHNGKKVTTTNLWHQGTIPDIWKSDLPDNAEFE